MNQTQQNKESQETEVQNDKPKGTVLVVFEKTNDDLASVVISEKATKKDLTALIDSLTSYLDEMGKKALQ